MDTKSILHRVSLRGLAKCKACGHYNGIRAIACKNKLCSLSKADAQRKEKPKIHAVQLIATDDAQIYSVQIRERDMENRNFVSITDKVLSSDANGTIISRNAICYVDTCKYDSNDINISCKHVKSSLEQCSFKAEALPIEPNIWMSLRLAEHVKQQLKSISAGMDASMPLVQRILSTVFVVRCDLSANAPAGLVHVLCTPDNDKMRLACACKRAKQSAVIDQADFCETEICVHALLVFVAVWCNKNRLSECQTLLASIEFLFSRNDECVLIDDMGSINGSHAYHSLDNTADEFIDNLDSIEMIQVPSDMATTSDATISLDTLDCDVIVDNELQFVSYKVELMNPVDVHESVPSTEMNGTDYIGLDGIYDVADINSWTIDGHEYSQFGQSDVFVDELLGSSGSVAQNSVVPMKRYDDKQMMAGTRVDALLDDVGYEEKLAALNATEMQMFSNWMDSVIEKINLAMDFNDDGHPEPIVFSVPHPHFDILRAKFSVGTKKKRLPNQTFQISDGKYKGLTLSNWIFSNIKLIKMIFTTSTMSLEPIRLFEQTSPNTYKLVESDSAGSCAELNQQTSHPYRKIRPMIYKTFLKTKTETNVKGKEGRTGLFSIEWIQNVLPKSQYGEMRIKLQFGHMKNDVVL